jgi:hypothetical protein
VHERECLEPECGMCSLQGMSCSMCLNVDIMFCYTGSRLTDLLTLRIFTLGFRRVLLKRRLGGKKTNSGKFIFFYKMS